MNISTVYSQLMVFFLLIGLGYLIRKKGLIDNKISKGLSRLLVEVALPALIINSINFTINEKLIANIKIMAILSFLIYLSLILLAELIARKLSHSNPRKTIFKFSLIFANTIYMGIPLIVALYPENGVFFVIINNIFFNLVLWTYGVFLLTKESNEQHQGFNLKKIFNNGLIAMLIGFIINLLQINLGPISGAIENLGGMTFPLSMIIIGSSLANVRVKNVLKDKLIYLIALLKLIIIPLLGLLIFRTLQLPPMLSNISILLLGAPVGASTVIFAERFGGDHQFASESVFVTTLLSIVTLPLLVLLVNS